MNHMSEQIKTIIDWIAGVVSAAAFAQIINWLIALPAAVYACMRIYDWVESRWQKRKASKNGD